MSKINGISKVCIGDTYTDPDDKKKALVFCFNSQDDLNKFQKLADFVNEKDLNNTSAVYDPETDQTFEVHFSDGHNILLKKKIQFKVDGMYENNKLLMKYDVIETFDGRKCNIAQNLPIVPIKFLDINIFNSKCVAKFKYNKVDTYIGNSEKNCANILSYITQKMLATCNNVKNGPNGKFKNDLISRPTEGKWTGWVHYHKIMDNGGTVLPFPFKIVITPDLIQIYDNKTTLVQKVDHKNVTWSCNDDGDCTVKDFLLYLTESKQSTKLGDFTKVVTQLTDKWILQDYNHCFVIEENDIHVICPMDYSEEYAVRTALAVAVDKKLVDAEANEFQPYKNGTSYKILFSTDTNIYFEDFDITVLPEAVREKKGNNLIEYKKIQPLKNIQCGFEFRLLSLPNQYHEISPYCCARFFTDENNFICMQQQSKCYIPLRHMIQLIRTNCLFAQGASTNNTNPIPANPLQPDQNRNNTKRAWSGEVVFQDLDNYKFKGELTSQRGYFSLDANNATWKVNNQVVSTFALETLNFLCDSPYPCLVADYVSNQSPFLDKGYDRDWQQSTLAKFWEENKVNQNDCMVLISEDTFYETSKMILTCATAPGQGNSMRTSVTEVYNKKIGKLKGEEPEMVGVPPAADNREFNALVISTTKNINKNTVAAAKTDLKVVLDGIMYKASGEYLFKYTDIIDFDQKAILTKFYLEQNQLPLDMKNQKVNNKCCFHAKSNAGAVFWVCHISGDKCYHDKAALYRTISTRGKRALSTLSADLRRKAMGRDAQVEDPFEFGLGPEFKKFAKKFNLDQLNEETFDNSKNGHWEGWVYETALTERNYNKIVSPVWMEISNGLIQFKTDDDSPKPYKWLKLYEYNQICADHCLPKDYINRRLSTLTDFDDIMYLKKAVNNVLGQIKNAWVEEGCVVMDFMSPIYQFGHSEIICAVDKMQGDKIRQAIDNSYYEALLDMDIDKQVRKPFLDSDKFWAKIILNDKLIDTFNQFSLDQYGIVGKKMSSDPKITKPLSPDVFNLTYAQIADDNFGTNCAFWYKNQRIRQRSEEMAQQIQDNNCCIKFFTKADKKKIEICTNNPSGKICIKQSREFMKGMKMGCLRTLKYSTDTGINNDDQKEKQIDIYHAKTIDDSDNGAFDGFVYFGSAIASSQTPRSNPYYMRIHKMSIEIYEDHNKQDKAILSIPTEKLKFNCAGKASCSPDKFLLFAQTEPKYMPVTNQIKTVFNLFKDSYGLTDKLNSACFILETEVTPYIVCPYIAETSASMKHAVVQAFILNHSCRRLSSIPDSDPAKVYHVIINQDGNTKEDDILVNLRGVISQKTNSVLVDYRKLDSDPVNKKRCAVWFKEVAVKFNFANPECCFTISQGGKPSTFCVKQDKICVGTAFKLMKSVWNGCMYNTPSQNVMKPSPDSEILGEKGWKAKINFDSSKAKYDVCPSERNTTLFDSNEVHNDYNVDIFNDVAYSLNKTLYKGWFNVYPIDISSETSWSLLNYYGELSPEAFKFYDSMTEKKNPKMVVRPDMLSMSCGKENACKPADFLIYLSQFNSTLSFLNNTIQSKLDLYEIKKEEGCAVLENIVANIPNYFIICAHIRKTRSHLKHLQQIIDKPTSYSPSRDILSAHFGKVIRKVVYDSYLIARKYVTPEILPEGSQPVKTARITLITSKNDYNKVSVSDQGVVANSALVVKFDDLQHCRVRYNLVYAPTDVALDNKPACCMRYMGPVNHEYICIKDLNCEYSTYKFAKKFNENCVKRKKRNNDDVFNELNTGNNVLAMAFIKNVFKAEIKYTNILDLNPSKALSTEEFKTKHKTLAIKYLFKIKELIHGVNVVDITKSHKLTTPSQDTTPPDAPSPVISGVTPRYIGETDDWTITAAKNKITQFKNKKNADTVTIIRNVQFIQTKEFSAIIGQKSQYLVLIYNDDGYKILEVTNSRVLLTNTSANLGSGYKSVEPYVAASGINVPGGYKSVEPYVAASGINVPGGSADQGNKTAAPAASASQVAPKRY